MPDCCGSEAIKNYRRGLSSPGSKTIVNGELSCSHRSVLATAVVDDNEQLEIDQAKLFQPYRVAIKVV